MTLEIENLGLVGVSSIICGKKRVYVIVYRIFLHYIEESQFLEKNQNTTWRNKRPMI